MGHEVIQLEEKVMKSNATGFLLIFSLILFGVTTAQDPGPFNVANSGFEDGDLTGWSVWPTSGTHQSVTGEDAHEGTQSLKMVGASTAVYQGFGPPVPGNVYYAKGFVKNPSSNPIAEGQEIRLEITIFDGSWGQLVQIFSTPITSDSTADVWHELSIATPCPEGAVYMNMGFNWVGTGDDATPGSAYCDDLVTWCLTTPSANTNLGFEEDEEIYNPDDPYEYPDNWWTFAYEYPDDLPSEITSEFNHTGNQCVAIYPVYDWYDWGDPWGWWGYWGVVGQSIFGPFEPGTPFYMGAWIMTPDKDAFESENTLGYVQLDFKDMNGDNIAGWRIRSKRQLTQVDVPDEWIWVDVWGESPPQDALRVSHYIGLQQYLDESGMLLGDDAIIATGAQIDPSDVKESAAGQALSFNLSQNYPNPFNPETSISYTINRAQQVKLTVYDILGQEIAVLQDGTQNMGEHRVRFDASGLSSGIYIYTLETENQTLKKRMVLMR